MSFFVSEKDLRKVPQKKTPSRSSTGAGSGNVGPTKVANNNAVGGLLGSSGPSNKTTNGKGLTLSNTVEKEIG